MNADPAVGPRAEAAEEEYVLSLEDLIRVLRRRLWAIALSVAVCVGAAVGFGLYQTPQYEGTIKLLVGQERDAAESSSLGSDVQGLQQLTQTMANLIDSRTVAEAVIARLDLDAEPEAFLDRMTVEQVPDTQVIQVSYRDPDPGTAQRVANAIGEEFSGQVSEVSTSANSVTATLWQRAAVPEEPVSPDFLRNGLLALMLGLVLGVGLAFLLEYFDDSWRSPEEAERISGVPIFGMVPEFEAPKSRKKGGR